MMTSLSCKEKNNIKYLQFPRSQNSETEFKIYFKISNFFLNSKLNGQKLGFNTPLTNWLKLTSIDYCDTMVLVSSYRKGLGTHLFIKVGLPWQGDFEVTFGAVHKRMSAVRGEGGLSYAHILQTQRDKGVLHMRSSILFCAKNTGFFGIYGVSTRTRGLSSVDILQTKKGSIFHDLVQTSFTDSSFLVFESSCHSLSTQRSEGR